VPRLEHLRIQGFKSIADASLEFGDINVCIGANGSGKSNLIDFFWLLGALAERNLRNFVRQRGGADLLLHYGRKRTPALEFSLCFALDSEPGSPASYIHYAATLAGSDDDLLFFAREAVGIQPERDGPIDWQTLDSGHTESALDRVDGGNLALVEHCIRSCKLHHYHDTSPTARVRGAGNLADNRFIRVDAGNLAAYLHRLRERSPSAYRRIVLTVRQIAPYFDDFEFSPTEDGKVSLTWYDVTREYLLSPLQLSDGTLRTIALIATLLRPDAELPLLTAFDEPELGLHPYALEVVLTLMSQLRGRCQLLLATQSTFLVDRFEVEDIVVVEAGARRPTSFRRLSRDELAPWLGASRPTTIRATSAGARSEPSIVATRGHLQAHPPGHPEPLDPAPSPRDLANHVPRPLPPPDRHAGSHAARGDRGSLRPRHRHGGRHGRRPPRLSTRPVRARP